MNANTKDKAVVEIERLGFSFTEDAQYPLENLDISRRVQVREAAHYAPKETVEQYAVQMGESVFPPIIVTSDGWLVDGNTRVGARMKRGEKFSPAIVLDIACGTAPQSKRDRIDALAATLNAQGGLRLTTKEARVAAIGMIRMGWTNENIARAIGVKASDVSAVRREQEAIARLGRVGISADQLSATALRALGGPKSQSLQDAPLRELATLAADAGFGAKEVTSAVNLVKQAGSEAEALEALGGLRQENGDRIVQKALSGQGKPSLAQILRQRIAFLDRYVGKEDELVETDPAVAGRHIEALNAAIAVLTEVLKIQEA